MKNFFFLLSLFLIAFQVFGASTWSPPTPDAAINGKLTVNSTAKASRPYPSMTTTQRDAITSPSEGETIFNTTTRKLNIYTNSAWGEISGGGGITDPLTATVAIISKKASIAGGYITSNNKVDGSFEDGSTQWSASVGTIVPTASTEFQGNYKGVWTGTGTGTLDLQWTATASNTFEASAQVNVQGEDDVYICAYVGTTETGCKLIPALSKIQKVSVAADSVMSSAFYLRLKHTGSDAFSIDVDDAKIEPWTPQAVNLVEKASARHYGTGLLSTTGVIRFPSTQIGTSIGNFLSYDSSTGRYTALRSCKLNVASTLVLTASGAVFGLRINGAGAFTSSSPSAAGGYQATLSTGEFDIVAGQYIDIYTSSTAADNAGNFFSITATAVSDNVVQSWQDGMASWSATSTIQIGATTTAPTKGTTDLDQVKWIKRGESAEFWYQYNQTGAGTSGSGDYLFSLPSGMQFADNVTKYSTLEGSGEWVAKNGIPAGSWYGSGNYNGSAFVLPYDSIRFRVGVVGGSIGSSVLNAVIGSGTGNLLNPLISFSLKFTAPINGFSNAPTLLALPTTKENRFELRVNADGTIASSNASGLITVTNTGTGLYTINYSLLNLTTTPQISIEEMSGNNLAASSYPRYRDILTTSATQTTIRLGYNGLGAAQVLQNNPFVFNLSKQSPDYTATGVFVGNVAKNQVAIVSHTAYGSISSGSWVSIGLSSEASSIPEMSIQSGALYLPAGEYTIEGSSLFHRTEGVQTRLYNVTDVVDMNLYGVPAYARNIDTSAVSTSQRSYFILTKPTLVRLEARVEINGTQGITDAFLQSTIGKYKSGQYLITKLNGN